MIFHLSEFDDVLMIRYCGGFLNAMDEANEGAPVFAKVFYS